MATTQSIGNIKITTDPAVNDGAAVSAVGTPLGSTQIRIGNITVAPIPVAIGTTTSGRVDLRDGATILGTWGISFASAVSAGVPGPSSIFPVDACHVFTTGINVLWTKGSNCVSAAINYSWGG